MRLHTNSSNWMLRNALLGILLLLFLEAAIAQQAEEVKITRRGVSIALQ